MPSNVSSEEAQAILDLAQTRMSAASVVATRDFRRPRRLSAAQLESEKNKLRKALPEIESLMRGWLRSAHKVELAGASEVDARELLQGLTPPFALLSFQCSGQACWAIWDAAACVSSAELALGSATVGAAQARALSGVESVLVESFLGQLVRLCAASLGVEASRAQFAQTIEAAGTYEIPRNSDSRRMSFELAIDGPSGASMLRLFFAGVEPQATSNSSDQRRTKIDLPTHLAQISVEVSAKLGFAELPLSELLGLEIGDVIALGIATDSLLEFEIDQVACATARLGSHDGRLAIRIEALKQPSEPETIP